MPINTTLSTNPLKRTREEKGKSLIEFPEDYCVVDIETTGFSLNGIQLLKSEH